MKKPKEVKREPVLDYHECARYVAGCLGIRDIRNIMDSDFSDCNLPSDQQVPYWDFWHHICDDVSNGCTREMFFEDDLSYWLDEDLPWVALIVAKFIEEFGEGRNYIITW